MSVSGILIGAALYGAFLYPVYLLLTRKQRRNVAAGAVFRRRVASQVQRGVFWS